ncbi:MAG: hypothetical protein AAGA21_10180 [Pseudomonadota bacterium]
MVNDFDRVLQLIESCYSAAADDEIWPGLLKEVREFLDGHGATLFFTDAQLRPIDRFFSDNVAIEAIADYQAHFHTIDIRMQRSIPGALNTIATDLDLVDEDIIKGHEFYQDFLRPAGHRYIVAAVLDLADGTHAFCSCHRGLKQDHADSEILNKARLLMPHLRRSLQLRNRLSMANARGGAAFEVLDNLGQAVFLIDVQGRIFWQNAWADRLLRQQDGLISSDHELRALSAPASMELQALIASAIKASIDPSAQPGGLMNVPRPSLKRPYQALVTPLAGMPELTSGSRRPGGAPSAAVFVMDLEQKSVPSPEVLRTLYKLTPAEARLATALGSGTTAKDYAERARLSVHYVRWLLKQVEGKTDTRRITDLIRLLAKHTGFFVATTENSEENKK